MKNVWIAEVKKKSRYGYTEKVELVDGPRSNVCEAKKWMKVFMSLTKRKNPIKIVTIHND